MKWIGQHIWSFISRFRSDVYLEAIDTSTETDMLVVDSAGKVTKRAIDAITVDVSDFMTNGADNRVLTATGTDAMNAEAQFTFDGSKAVAGLTNAQVSFGGIWTGGNDFPSVLTDDMGTNILLDGYSVEGVPVASAIKFNSSGAYDQADAWIEGPHASGTDKSGGDLILIAGASTGNDASGSFKFYGHPGGGGTGSSVNNPVEKFSIDGAGNTIIAGTLTMGSTAFVNNSGVVQVATQGTIDHDSLANFVANEHIDWTGSSAGTVHSSNIPTLNQDTTGEAATVATIAGLAPNTATTQATQPNITTMTGFVTGSANEILTDDGDGTVTSESGLTFSGTTLASTAALHTQINSIVATSMIQNTGNNSLGGQITLSGNRAGADAQDDDILGTILFTGLDDGTPTAQSYGQIQTKVADATSGQEAGKMEFTVAEFDGTNTTVGLLIDGDTNVNGQINVTIGAGAASVTTIAGTLAMGSTTAEKVASGQHIHKQVKVTLSQADCNDLDSIPIELIPAQGADTIIVPGSGIMMVDNNTSVNQTNSAADLNFHYADKEPGSYLTTALFHIRRFMVGNNLTDIVYSLGELTGFEISQNLTDCVNKAVEVSVDSALTNNSMTSITIYLSYYVIDIS